MKKVFLLTSVLLALTATFAFAQVNLAWNNCIASASSAANKNFTCDDNGANVVAPKLVPSFIADRALPQFNGTQLVIDVQSAGPNLASWWQLGLAECRDGAIAIGSPSGLTALCVNSMAGANAGGLPDYQSFFAGPNRARLRTAFSRDTEGNFANGAHIMPLAITLGLAKSWDGGEGEPFCTGCLDAACIVLNSVEVFQTLGAPGGDPVYNSQATRNYVTWQLGNIGGTVCPGETPTKNATWGSVKSLYR